MPPLIIGCLKLYKRFLLLPWVKITERTVLVFLVLALLWKGGKGLEATWLLTALAWMCTVVYWGRKPKSDPVPAVLWFGVIMFALWTVLSFLQSTTGNYGLDEVLRTGSLVLLFLWAMRTAYAEKRKKNGTFLDRFAYALVVALLLAGLVGLFVYIFQPVNRFVGTFFDYRFHTDYWPNAWADWLLLVWPIVAFWIIKSQSFADSLIRLFAFGLVIGFLLLSYSRGAMIAFGGQLVLWSFIVGACHWKREAFPWKGFVVKTGMVVAIAIAVFFAANSIRSQFHPVQSVSQKITFTAAEEGSSVSERRQFWKQAWILSKEKPLTGWGPYSFRFIQPRLQTQVLATSDHPHNVILKFAMERGWVAALLFLVIIASLLFKALSFELSSIQPRASGFLLIGITGLLAHSMIDFNLQFVAISMLLWMMLGLLAASVPWDKRVKLNKKLIRFVEVTLATVLLIVAVIEARGIIFSSFGRHAEASGEAKHALAWYSAAGKQWMSRDMHLSRAKILFGEKRFTETQSALDDYFEENEEDFRAWKRQGDILRSQRDVDGSLDAYQIAYDIGGRFNDIGIARARVKLLLAASCETEVDTLREEYTALMKEFVDSIERNAHYIALSPNVEEVVALAHLFEEISSRREAPLYQVLAARADHHSRVEREKVKARAPGYLW